MQASNLLLDNYVINELNYSLNQNFDKETVFEIPSITVKCVYEKLAEAPNKRKCEIEILLTNKSKQNFPYQFKILMAGDFTINTEIDVESGEKLFRVNAPALLYSAAREIIFNLTSHSEHSPYLLPSVTFLDEAKPTAEKTPVAENKS